MSSLVAAAASNSGSAGLLIYGLPLLLIGFMFITSRRRVKESQRVQSSLTIGDEIMTTSGMLGRITALDEQVATLEVSPGVNIRVNRRAIAGPAPDTTTSPEAGTPKASASSEPETDTQSDSTRLTD
jgi:preprotein translocase subunit YajC